MILEKHVEAILNKYNDTLKVVRNSEKQLLDLTNRSEDSLRLDIMYKEGYKYTLGIIIDDRTKDSWLIDSTSIKELTKYGYICNLAYIESGNTIKNHENKIKANGYKEFEIDSLENNIECLSDMYGCVVVVDNELECVGRLRHSIEGICFNVDAKIAYFKVATPIDLKILSVEEFKKLLKKKKDDGKFCINATSNNAALAKNYVLIEHEHYSRMLAKLDKRYLKNIRVKANGSSRNKINYARINYKMAKIMYNSHSVIAVPIPNKFKSKEEFRSAFYETDINRERFIEYNYSNIDLENLKPFLLEFYENIKNFDEDQIIDCVRNYENNISVEKFESFLDEKVKDTGKDVNKTEAKEEITEESVRITDITYVTDNCDIRIAIKYNSNTDNKYIVLIRDNYKDNEIIIPNSEASYKEYLYGSLDIKAIKKSIHTVLKDFNNTRKVDDILEELGLI